MTNNDNEQKPVHPQKLWRHYDISDNSYHKYWLRLWYKNYKYKLI
jgi:hypothetical protein